MIPGDPTAWLIGVPVLIAVIVIGALVLRRDRRPVTIGFVVAAALVVIAITMARAKYASSALDMSSMQSASGVAPIPVTTTILRDVRGGSEVQAPGNVAPFLTQDIVARASGLVTGLSIYAGDRVRAGDVIARLDEPELQSDASAATAQARAAESDVAARRAQDEYWAKELSREHSLFEQGAVSAQEYQNERAQAVAAQAQASAAQQQAEAARSNAQSKSIVAGYAAVVVPYDGIVVKRLIDPGAYVQAGTTIARIATIDRLRVQAQVAQQDLGAISVGTPLDATFDSGGTIRGRVSSISPVVDAATHTATVEAIVSNANGAYQPGGYAHITLHVQQAAQRGIFSIPSNAVTGGLHPTIWTVVNGTAHRNSVDVLSDDGTQARVRGPLNRGMHIIVDGASNLEDGDAVTETTP